MSDMRTSGIDTRAKAKASKAEKAEPIKMKVIKEREGELVILHKKAKDAAEGLTTALKKAAEDSGLKPDIVRKYVAAKAGDDFEGVKGKIEQLALVFDV